MSEKRVVMVVGMHRSGTSAITKSLQALGVSLGDNLLPAENCNKKGFWEDKVVIELNDKLFALAGMAWCSLSEFPLVLLDTPAAKKLEDEAVELISKALNQHDTWGFKDPRCAALLSFWQRVLARVGVPVCYLFALRNPLDIIASLKSRSNFTAQRTQQLWLLHTFNNLDLLANENVCFLSFENLLRDPEAEVRRIGAEFSLSVNEAQLKEFATNYIDPTHCHSLQTTEALMAEPAIFPLVQQLYMKLYEVALGEIGFSILLDGMTEWRANYLKTLHGTLNEFCIHADSRDYDVNKLLTLLDKNCETIGAQQQLIGGMKHELLDSREQLIAYIKHHDEVVETLQQESHDFKCHHDELVEKLIAQVSGLESSRAELDALKRSKSWRITAPLRRVSSLYSR